MRYLKISLLLFFGALSFLLFDVSAADVYINGVNLPSFSGE